MLSDKRHWEEERDDLDKELSDLENEREEMESALEELEEKQITRPKPLPNDTAEVYGYVRKR